MKLHFSTKVPDARRNELRIDFQQKLSTRRKYCQDCRALNSHEHAYMTASHHCEQLTRRQNSQHYGAVSPAMIAATRKVDVSKYGSSIPSMIIHTPNVGAESVNKTCAHISDFVDHFEELHPRIPDIGFQISSDFRTSRKHQSSTLPYERNSDTNS